MNMSFNERIERLPRVATPRVASRWRMRVRPDIHAPTSSLHVPSATQLAMPSRHVEQSGPQTQDLPISEGMLRRLRQAGL